jgi:hypothetical protein
MPKNIGAIHELPLCFLGIGQLIRDKAVNR